MALFLPTTREILELPTQTASNVYRATQLGAVLGFEFAPVAEMEMAVKGGDVFSGRVGTNRIVSAVEYDASGRPIEELVINEDSGYETTRKWEYPLSGDGADYTSWIEETGDGLQTNKVVGEGLVAAYRNNREFVVEQAQDEAGNTIQRLLDTEGSVLEEARYDSSGRLIWQRLQGRSQAVTFTYAYDSAGRVQRATTSPGSETLPDGTALEDDTYVKYLPGGLTVITHYAGMTSLARTTEIRGGDMGHPTAIKEVSGLPETGLRTIDTTVKYRQLVTVQTV